MVIFRAIVVLTGAEDGDRITSNNSHGIKAEQPVQSGGVMNLVELC